MEVLVTTLKSTFCSGGWRKWLPNSFHFGIKGKSARTLSILDSRADFAGVRQQIRSLPDVKITEGFQFVHMSACLLKLWKKLWENLKDNKHARGLSCDIQPVIQIESCVMKVYQTTLFKEAFHELRWRARHCLIKKCQVSVCQGSILVDAPNMDKAFGYEASLIVGHHSSCDWLTFESLVCCRFTEQIHCSSLDKDCTSRTGVVTQDDKLLVSYPLRLQRIWRIGWSLICFWFSFHYHCFALFWAEFSSLARPLETSDFSRCNPFILIPLRLVKTKLSNNSFCPSLCFHRDCRLLKGDTYPQCLEAQVALGKRESDCFPLGSPAFWGVCCCSVYST